MNTTTKAQRINKRQDEIWDKAKRAQAETAAEQSEAPLGRCPKCKQPLRYYDGALGYEAARCDECNFERDLNAEANGMITVTLPAFPLRRAVIAQPPIR